MPNYAPVAARLVLVMLTRATICGGGSSNGAAGWNCTLHCCAASATRCKLGHRRVWGIGVGEGGGGEGAARTHCHVHTRACARRCRYTHVSMRMCHGCMYISAHGPVFVGVEGFDLCWQHTRTRGCATTTSSRYRRALPTLVSQSVTGIFSYHSLYATQG